MSAFSKLPTKEVYIAIVFCILAVTVFSIHVSHRTAHFQECDSTVVYEALHNFPIPSFSFNSYVSQGSVVSAEQAQSILAWPLVRTFTSLYREQYHITDEGEFNARVVRALTRLNPVTAFRAAYIAAVSQIPLPFFIKSFFALPTAATYFPGAGLLFGLLSGPNTSYEDFMSRATLLTLVLFLVSAFLLYVISRRMGIVPLVGAIAGTLFLFSISIYSYGYHLGSTIFNIVSGFAWLLVFVKYWNTSAFFKKMSLATAAIVFFNYLIVVYWSALFLFIIYKESRGFAGDARGKLKKVVKSALVFLKTQWLACAAFVFIGLFFYPPGQSYRGTTSFETLPGYAYNIILNFFGFYNDRGWLNVLQFCVAGALLVVAAIGIFSKKIDPASPRYAFRGVVVALFAVYAVLVAGHVLAFFPSRHILVFAPVMFLLVALALQDVVDRFRPSDVVLVGMWAVLVVLGFLSLFPRISATEDRFAIGPVDPDVKKVFIYDCGASWGYKQWNVGVPVEVIKPSSFAPEVNQTYLYVSQTAPMNEAFTSIAREKQQEAEAPAVQVLSESYTPSDACFLGYHPSSSCLYGSPNRLYRAKFIILPSKE